MKLSKIYKVNHRRFRYNYDNALLCWIDENGEVIDEIGLSRDNWKEDPRGWCEEYSARIDEELMYL